MISTEKNFVANQIIAICEANQESIKEFAERVGVPYSTMLNYSQGKSVPKYDFFLTLYKAGINLDWFVTGKGAMNRADRQESDWCLLLDPIMRAILEFDAKANGRSLGQEISWRLETALGIAIAPEMQPTLEASAEANGRSVGQEISWRLHSSLAEEEDLKDRRKIARYRGDGHKQPTDQDLIAIDLLEKKRKDRCELLGLPYHPVIVGDDGEKEPISDVARSLEEMLRGVAYEIARKELEKDYSPPVLDRKAKIWQTDK